MKLSLKQSIGFCAVALGLMSSVSAYAKTSSITFDLLNTVQDCNHEGHKSTWCTMEDKDESTKKSGVVARISAQLDRTLANPSKAQVYAAEFSFSNKLIQAKLCELGKAGVTIQVYLDRGQDPGLDLSGCQKDSNKPNYKIDFLGGFSNFPEWRLHHNKTIYVDTGDGSPIDIDFASGNLSSYGASLHLENWVMMQAPVDSNIVRATQCLFKGLAAAVVKTGSDGSDWSKDPEVMETYTSTIESCYAKNKVVAMNQPEKALALEEIAPIFAPNYENLGSRILIGEIKKVAKIGKGAYIYIAIEHFTKPGVAYALQNAVNNGVDVRIIMNAGTVTGATEVATDGPFYESNIKGSGMNARFIETNPDAGGNGQQMHNKFTILNGKRVFSGAGHLTSSGLESNYETLYLTANDSLNKQYAVYFKKLWDNSVDEQNMKNGTVEQSTTPETLNSNFLKLIGQ